VEIIKQKEMSNYLNYNLFNQIAQTSNYDRKVANAQKDLEYAQQLEDRANKRVQEQMMQQDKVAAYMEAIDDQLGQLLPEDEARIKELEKQKRQIVIDGVASAQGDYKQFLLQGGAKTLREYKKSIMDSEQVTNALYNKDTMKQIREDMSEQKILKDVDVVYTDANGNEKTERVTVDNMMTLFNEGKIKKLNYRGGAKPVDIKPFTFSKTPNPNDPYNSDFVSLEEIRDFAIASGQDPEIADKIAQGYASFQRNGKWYSNFQWGVKDQDWTGTSKSWGRNGKAQAGAKKYGDALGAIMSMEPTGARVQSDWTSRDGKVKSRVTIDDYQPDAVTMDKIYDAMGLILNRDGSYTGAVQNSIGFTNMENGRIHNIKGSDYQLTGVGNKVEVVRDAKTGEVQLYAPINIMVSEDYMEEHLGEGAWWNGWTMSSSDFGGVTTDKDVNGNDMRELTVSVNIPLDEYNRERINQNIGWEQGQVIGSIEQEDFVSASISKPQGARATPQPQTYQRFNNQIFSSTPQFGQSMSDSDKYMQLYPQVLRDIQNSPEFKGATSSEINNFANKMTLRMMNGQ
jgi:hypothetical protein